MKLIFYTTSAHSQAGPYEWLFGMRHWTIWWPWKLAMVIIPGMDSQSSSKAIIMQSFREMERERKREDTEGEGAAEAEERGRRRRSGGGGGGGEGEAEKRERRDGERERERQRREWAVLCCLPHEGTWWWCSLSFSPLPDFFCELGDSFAAHSTTTTPIKSVNEFKYKNAARNILIPFLANVTFTENLSKSTLQHFANIMCWVSLDENVGTHLRACTDPHTADHMHFEIMPAMQFLTRQIEEKG